MSHPLILQQYPGMGRGVCSTVDIKRGAVVEVSAVIPIAAKDWKLIKKTLLEAYVYAWGRTGKDAAMPLGFGGLFNHSDDANLVFFVNQKQQRITFRARRDIPAFEQLTINYQWSAKDRKKYFAPAPE